MAKSALSSITEQMVTDPAKKAWKAAVPNPARAVYSLGAGIGPMIQQIVQSLSAKDKKDKPSKGSKASTDKQQQIFDEVRKSNKMMITQLSTIAKILKNIERLNIIEAVELDSARRRTKLNLKTAGAGATAAGSEDQTSAMARPKGEPSSALSGIEMPSIFKAALFAGGITGIFNMLPKEVKEALGSAASTIASNFIEPVTSGMKSLFLAAWERSNVGTIIGSLVVAKMTGILDLAVNLAKGVATTGRGAYTLGKAMSAPTGPTVGATTLPTKVTPAPAPPQPLPTVSPAPNVSTKGLDIYNRLGTTGLSRAGYSADEISRIRTAANAPAAAPALQPAPAASIQPSTTAGAGVAGEVAASSRALKAAQLLGKVGVVGTVASLGLGAYDYYKTGQQEKEGKISKEEATVKKGGIVGSTGGGLALGMYGAGKGALIGSALGPVGTIVGGVLGGLAGGIIGSWAGREVGETAGQVSNLFNKDGAGTTGPSPTATQPGVKEVDLSTTRFRDMSEEQKRAFLEGQAMAEGFGRAGTIPTTHNNPGAIMFSPGGFAERYGAVAGKQAKDGPVIAHFPTIEQGRAAQRALWETPRYSDRPLAEALQTWHAASAEAATNYARTIARRMKEGGEIVTASAPFPGPSSSRPSTAMSLDGASPVTPFNITTAQADIGQMIASNVNAINGLITAMTGQQIKIDASQIVNAVSGQGGANEARTPPSRTSPTENPIATAIQFAAGVSAMG